MDIVNFNNDILFEILIRVDPDSIFNCILVCNNWFELITKWNFGIKYLNKWNGKLLVGLMMHTKIGNPLRTNMLPTTNLGRQVNDNTMISAPSHAEKFICKSPNSSHMLYARDATTLYAWTMHLNIGSSLPPPPVHFKRFMANIFSDDDNFYTVILAEAHLGRLESTVNIQTFSSCTGRWEQSTLTCTTSLSLDTDVMGSGIVNMDRNVIYWRAKTELWVSCLAAWDIIVDRKVTLILGPLPESSSPLRILFYEGMKIHWNDLMPCDFNTYYGVSPNGALLSATCTFYNKGWDSLKISILTFDENAKDWSLMYTVMHASIWTKNSALLTSLFDVKPLGFKFVSFLPGRLDSVLVGMEDFLFVYHLESQNLEHLDSSKYDNHNLEIQFQSGVNYYPLTMLDLKVWPSSPHALHLNHQT